jgi:hypothetical protein
MQITTTYTSVLPGIPAPGPMIGTSLIGTIFIFVVTIGFFVYMLQRNIRSQKGPELSSMKPSLTLLTLSLFIIALFAPAALNIYPLGGYNSSVNLTGMSWQIMLVLGGYLMFDFFYFLVGFPFTFFRIVFVYSIYRYYLGKTTKNRVVIFGIISELQLPLIGLALIPLILSSPLMVAMYPIPIPILLIAGLLILRYVPRVKGISDWTGSDESKEWWDKEQEETSVSDNA